MEVVLETDTLSPVSRPDTSLRIRKFIKTIENSSKFRGAALERRISAKITDPRITVVKQDQIEFTLFQGPLSFLSPSFRASITIGNKSFRSAEQFYQYSRAVYAKDRETADAIHEALTPLKARSLGRHVRNFDQAKWDEIAPDVMTLAQYHKFMQNRVLREALLETGNSAIVYCDRFDKKWGCGLSLGQNPTDVTAWKGENNIGKILTLLREHIMSGDCNLMERVSRCDLLCPYGQQETTLRIQAVIDQLPLQFFDETPIVHPLNAVTYLNSTLGLSFVCFQGSRSVLGNCFRAPFPLDNEEWPSVQHYFHHFKAVMFGDHESALTIRSAASPTVAKQLGRRVRNFDPVQWELVSTEVMTRAVFHKFAHDSASRASLLSTNDSIIVECGLFNKEWSNGLSMTDSRSGDPRSWRSDNKLGKILTLVRDHFR